MNIVKNLLEQRKRLLMRFQEVIQKRPVQAKPVDIPDGVFTQCEQCNSAIYKDDLEKNLDVCPYCGFHFKINAKTRIQYTLDEGSFIEINDSIESLNPLCMPEYDDKLKKGKKMSKIKESFISGVGMIEGIKVAFGV